MSYSSFPPLALSPSPISSPSPTLSRGADINSGQGITLRQCTVKTALKVGGFVVNAGVFGLTLYVGIKELLNVPNIVNLTLSGFFNGASVSVIGHYAFSLFSCCALSPEVIRKMMSEVVFNWSYETVFALSQVYLNLAPANLTDEYAVLFIEGFGMLLGAAALRLAALKLHEINFTTEVPDEKELFRTCCLTTRNKSRASKVFDGIFVTSAVGLTVLNFVIRDKYAAAGDFGVIGLYQNLIALFSGTVLGYLLARELDNAKEKLEKGHRLIEETNGITELPRLLKVLRIAKNLLVIATPLSIGALLAAPTSANSVGDFFIKNAVGDFGALIC